MFVPRGVKKLTTFAEDLVDACTVSQSKRAAAYKVYGQWIEMGRGQGGLALANLLFAHIDRLQSHIFSPTNLRFTIDFERPYDKGTNLQARAAARVLTRQWKRANIDLTFAAGVESALSYGCCIPKLLAKKSGDGIKLSARLVMPWNFGVFDESRNGLVAQEAVNETVFISLPEVWRRISHLPDSEKLYKRIKSQADSGETGSNPANYMGQVLSTAVLDTSLSRAASVTGGVVNLVGEGTDPSLSPQLGVDLIKMHELWVRDDNADDYTTIQIIAPDILVAPRMKRVNLFSPHTLPYGLIQPNEAIGYFWGRSEIVDLMPMQELLSTTLDDIKRVMGQQFDKLLAFAGTNDVIDETYALFRAQGYINMGLGGSVNDVTPQLPADALNFVNLIIKLMEMTAGFSNVLSGQGEAGVRSDAHAETLARMASPRLRDRSLIVERNCGDFANASFSVMQAKDARAYWVIPESEDSEFLLKQLPEDRVVSVDSHSSSPIYQEDHNNAVAFGMKAGIVDGESAIEMLDLPNKDILLERYKEKQKQQAKMFQEVLEVDPKAAAKMLSGGRK